MTKITKWWKRMTFWTKFKGLIGLFTVGSEAGLFLAEAETKWKVLPIVAAVIIGGIGFLVEDKNNNGIVDALEEQEDNTPK
jgi:hypothetical protein